MNTEFTIAIGSDHAGYELKGKVIQTLENQGFTVEDKGCYSEESVDYPDFGHAVAEAVSTRDDVRGIVICGSGNGINMSVNKHRDVRSALCWEVALAELAVQHNNANVLALPARFIEDKVALACVQAFITESFEGGRHERRVNKINCA